MSQQTNPLNEPNKKYVQGSNRFPAMKYRHYTTGAYADVNPFFVMETVEGDRVPLRSQHQVRTHTLAAPLLSNIYLKKDYFHVPMRAILPRTFEQIYVNPTQGTDVPDDANCAVGLYLLLSPLQAWIDGNGISSESHRSVSVTENVAEMTIKMMLYFELFFSDGSLLSRLGYRYSSMFRYYPNAADENFDPANREEKYRSFDVFFDNCLIPWMYKLGLVITIGESTYGVTDVDTTLYPNIEKVDHSVSMSRLLELMRSNPDFTVSKVTDTTVTFGDLCPAGSIDATILTASNESATSYLNYGRCLAYQLSCAEFYTDAHVDVMYSAEMYRDFHNSLYIELANAINSVGYGSAPKNAINMTYAYNGRYILYDVFAGAYITALKPYFAYLQIHSAVNWANYTTYNLQAFSYFLAYMQNIFGINRALRYGDYFTGARPTTLAVGNVTAPVVSAEVSAIDMNRSVMTQRFLNFVNRTSRKFRDYIQALTGQSPDEPVDKPEYLGHTESLITGFEVENTGENQGNIVTLLKSQGGDYAFDITINEPGILLGVFYFEAQRVYANSLDRHAFKRDRFDMFNQFFQYDVDQQIYRSELNPNAIRLNGDDPFAYTGRYMEYKQRLPICTGGFKEYLKNYLFITDVQDSGNSDINNEFINEEYIRSSSSELDRFYSSLSNHSLAGYFHFYLMFDNQCEPMRRMDFNPSVL